MFPRWTKLNPTGSLPPGRRGHTAIYDANTDRMVVFGGDPVGCSVPKYNDVWVLVGTTATHGVPKWVQLNPAGGPPPARSDHSAVYDPVNNTMTIAGGYGGGQNYNDVWVLTHANGFGGTPTWTQLNPTGQAPSATGYRAVVYDPVSNRMTVFGGWNCCSSPYVNDTTVLTNANGLGGAPAWIKLSPSGTIPSTRYGSKAVYDGPRNTMTIFGGTTDTGQVNEVWSLSSSNGLNGQPTWTKLNPSGNQPAPRGGSVSEPTAIYDAGYGRMGIFGGGTPSGLLNDVWVLSGLGSGGSR